MFQVLKHIMIKDNFIIKLLYAQHRTWIIVNLKGSKPQLNLTWISREVSNSMWFVSLMIWNRHGQQFWKRLCDKHEIAQVWAFNVFITNEHCSVGANSPWLGVKTAIIINWMAHGLGQQTERADLTRMELNSTIT